MKYDILLFDADDTLFDFYHTGQTSFLKACKTVGLNATEKDYDVYSAINQKRWEIEECFRIMKTEFKARPMYLSRKDRITAHFTTCFTALVLYRILEKKLNEKYTCEELINTIRSMDMLIAPGEGYIPTYTRTGITDSLHEAFGFRTDYQITSQKNMKKILNQTKKR